MRFGILIVALDLFFLISRSKFLMEKIYISKNGSVGFESSMNYRTDTTRLSVLVVTILLVGSSFAFLPAFASSGARTNAANNSPTANGAPPSLSAIPNVIFGAPSPAQAFAVTVTNPSSNAYAITSITIVAPSGWTFSGSVNCGTANTLLGSPGAASSTAIQCTSGSGTGLPPGFSTTLHLGTLAGPSAPATSPPVQGIFTSLVVDSGSSSASYAGGSVTVWAIAPAHITSTSWGSATTFTAGGAALTVTTQLNTTQAGVPIVWTIPTGVSYPASGFTTSFSPATSTTGSTGAATTTWTPSNGAGDVTHVNATIGTNTATSANSALSLTTVAGAPTKVSFYFTYAGSHITTDYLGGANKTVVSSTLYAESYASGTSEISLALSDSFGNAVGFGSVTSITLTGVGGQFLQGGSLFTTLTGTSSGTNTGGHFNIVGATSPMPLSFTSATYVQSSGYGAIGEISASVVSSGVTYTGSSGQIVTSALGTLATVTTNPTPTVKAGTSILVEDFLNTGIANYYQPGVPITLNLCTSPCATTAHYDGKFANGASSITLTTNSSGVGGGVESLMPANTTVGDVAIFNATATAPTNAASTNKLAGAASTPVTTVAGSIATLVVNIAAGTGNTAGPNLKYIVNGTTAYVSAAYADAYGNLVANAPSNQIQIALAASAGALSATSVYISAGDLSTNATTPNPGFGAILWTLPNTVGTTATITASANVNGKAVQGTGSVTTVSASPSINVTSPKPVSGVLYAPSTFVTFQGYANATVGSASTTITTVGYKVGTGGWLSISTTVAHNTVWTVPIVLVAGLNTVQFNVTDSAGKTTVGPSYQVLVDSSVPTFGTITVANGTSTATVNVTATQGDLNASSVTATANGTAVAASSITVTGTNNIGHSVTYVVTVKNLAKGSQTLVVSAKTLAGLSNSATATVTSAGGGTVCTSGCSSTISYPSPAKYQLFGTYRAVNVTITNTQSTSMTVVVLAVFHNAAGQTLQVGTSTATVAAGASTTAFVVSNQPSGTYSVNVFVWSTSGSSLSSSQTITVTY